MSAILERIKKLLKLAENAGDENEAALAADRARELMHKHNIAEAELRLDEPSEHRSVEEIIHGDVTDTRKKVAWHMRIAGVVDEQFGCHAYWHGGGIRFYGRLSAVQAATYTTQYLMREVEALTDKLAPSSVYSRKYRNAFRLGCAQRIRSKIQQQLDEQKARARGEVTAETITREQIEELRAEAAKDGIRTIMGVPRDELLTICDSVLRSDADKTPSLARACRATIARVINERTVIDIVVDAPAVKASDGVLMVLKKDQDEVDEGYQDFMHPKFKNGKRRKGRSSNVGNHSSHSGYQAGKEAGASIKINASRGGLPRGQDSLE